MKNAPTLARASRRPLQRNLRRRRLGGVCAGLADYLGISPAPIRLFFLGLPLLPLAVSLLSPLKGLLLFPFFAPLMAVIAVLAYVALWIALPADIEKPIPKVSSKELTEKLWRMGKAMDKVHRQQSQRVADLAQEVFDAVKILAPYFEQPEAPPLDKTLRDTVTEQFPKLLERLDALPVNIALNQLGEFRAQFQQAANELIEKEFKANMTAGVEMDSPELAAWRELLQPLQERLRDSTGPETLVALRSIEEKLAFILERIGGGGEVFDLRPFEVRKIAFEYLPDTLNQYLQLPSSMAKTQRLNSGKTAEESLNEQLNLLDGALHDLAKSLFEKDAGGLLVHGRFLKEKFAEQPFRLER
jgi:phage shock protein PspC (stress-responsive transcriptional regulator)